MPPALSSSDHLWQTWVEAADGALESSGMHSLASFKRQNGPQKVITSFLLCISLLHGHDFHADYREMEQAPQGGGSADESWGECLTNGNYVTLTLPGVFVIPLTSMLNASFVLLWTTVSNSFWKPAQSYTTILKMMTCLILREAFIWCTCIRQGKI